MRQTFSPFGQILEIRVFPDKGYSFVRYVDALYLIPLLFLFKPGQSLTLWFSIQPVVPLALFSLHRPGEYLDLDFEPHI